MKLLPSKKTIIITFLIVVFAFSLGAAWAKNKSSEEGNVYHDLEIFAKVVERISSNYVDEVDAHKLVNDAIESMMRELDPHSQFLSGLDYEDLMVSTRGEFGGLGIYISFRDNYPTVISAIEGTPADEAGIVGGDQIIEIEGQSSNGWHVDRAVKLLRGEPGTKVRFKISRPGLKEPIDYELTREVIKVKSVPFYGDFNGFGYIKVINFARQTRDEIQNALANLEKKQIKGLVIDLRSNPGGLLQAAKEVSELFLDKDKLIVYTKGRLSSSNQKYYSSDSHVHNGYPIIVMVNGASASASEIFAGALQDWDAGFIIGQPTFGKGTVQTVFSLSDTEAVKLTTARYFTPSGRSIDKDHEINLPSGQAGGAGAQVTDQAESSSAEIDSTAEMESKKEERPVYNTASGRVVYGGGGITPDLELKPKKYTELQRRLERDGLFFSFAIEYSTEHKVAEDFKVDDQIMNDFKAFLKERKFKFEEKDLTKENLDYIRLAMLREVIYKNFGRQAMYRVLLDHDDELQKAFSLLKKEPTLNALFSYAAEQSGPKKASLE
jgi:carboxyl-terminal processing protease